MDNYGKHMFTEAVQAEQDQLGMRERFQQVYRNRFTDGLTEDTNAFIQSRTSFYMATVSETGWPYVQHRGGPPGFLKVIGEDTIGFADYTGNKQLISKGNLSGNDKVSLFLMDYPRRARLKLIGHAEMLNADEDPALAEQLAVEGEGPVERLVRIRVAAYDWNCSKYIVPRYNETEVEAILGPTIRTLKEENERLKALLAGKDKTK